MNVQETRGIVEMHDGSASAVAWLLYAREQGIPPTLEQLVAGFDRVVVLRDRVHPSGEVWHPYVPPEVACADRLERVRDPEHAGREVRKAITPEGRPVYFDDTEYFSGDDAAERLESMAEDFRRRAA